MTNQEKAVAYDDYLRAVDNRQREISKLKSEYAGNIPDNIQLRINDLNKQISNLVIKTENLFR